MNNFKKISAIILALCTAATILTSCKNNDETTDISTTALNNTTAEINEEPKTTVVTDNEGKTVIQTILQTVQSNTYASKTEKVVTGKQTVKVSVTDKKGNISVSVSEKIVTIPNTTKVTTTTAPPKNTTRKPTVKTTVKTTKKPVINDTVNEKAVGIALLSKSDPVQSGNHASVVIQGKPGKTYSIEFYDSPSSVAQYKTLENKTADANGFVSWAFKIPSSCTLGKRKIIIKEINSSNYIETSITIK